MQWLTGTDLMPQLLAVLEQGHSADAAKHAAEVQYILCNLPCAVCIEGSLHMRRDEIHPQSG